MPALFGLPLSPDEEVPSFYFRNASLFVFPLLTIYFMWKRGLHAVSGLWLALLFAAAVVFANVFPFHNSERLDHFPTGQRHAGAGGVASAHRLVADGHRCSVRRRPLVLVLFRQEVEPQTVVWLLSPLF